MPLSRSVRAELGAERRTLAQTVKHATERIAAIDMILGDEADTPRHKRVHVKRAKRREPETMRLPMSVQPIRFRDTLRALLQDGYKAPGEVIQLLRDGGI